jgi:hypothetical protein
MKPASTMTDVDDWRSELTLSVPRAGRVAFDLGRSASYAAAQNGQIPTIKIGGRIRVPTARLLELLGQKAS